MSNFKPLLATALFILVIGFFLNVFIAPHLDTTEPVTGSVLANFSNHVENGWEVTSVPVIGTITVNPVSWLWLGIDGVTDFMVEQLNILTYIPDTIALVIIVLSILGLAYSVVTLIRGN